MTNDKVREQYTLAHGDDLWHDLNMRTDTGYGQDTDLLRKKEKELYAIIRDILLPMQEQKGKLCYTSETCRCLINTNLYRWFDSLSVEQKVNRWGSSFDLINIDVIALQ